jgi:YHS domain-containing protein
MVKDPVCGMAISENTAKERVVYRGQTYYFCSALCRQLFEREPQKYVPPAEDRERTASS